MSATLSKQEACKKCGKEFKYLDFGTTISIDHVFQVICPECIKKFASSK